MEYLNYLISQVFRTTLICDGIKYSRRVLGFDDSYHLSIIGARVKSKTPAQYAL